MHVLTLLSFGLSLSLHLDNLFLQKRAKLTTTQPTETGGSKRPLSSVSPISTVIQPTVEGMQQVAAKIGKGHVVAIPTECTYEVTTQLKVLNGTTVNNETKEEEEDDWAENIQALWDAAHIEPSDVSELQEQSLGRIMTGNTVSFSSTNSLEAAAAGTNGPISNNPTTAGTSTTTCPSSKLIPHVYVHHQVSLEGPFWRKCLPKRPFAVRNKQGEVLAADAFNESHQLVRLLATKVWPGPCLIHIAVQHPLPGLTITRENTHYLALRSLCHPLTVKVYRELHLHHHDAASGNKNKRTKTKNSLVAPNSPVLVDPILASPGRTVTPAPESDVLLVGTPLQITTAVTDTTTCSSFVTRAAQVGSDVAVLNGEESHDIFAVPPCTYGRPCPDALWLDPVRRTVLVLRDNNDDNRHRWTAQQLRETLQMRTAPQTDKERVMQAVLGRWKVVEDAWREGNE